MKSTLTALLGFLIGVGFCAYRADQAATHRPATSAPRPAAAVPAPACFQAAEHGATFPKAQQVRASMTLSQMADFARGSMKGKPAHVKKARNPIANLKHFAHPKRSKSGGY